jgi:molybdopterin synthase sulfur carrier subunit
VSVVIRVPTQLRSLTSGAGEVSVDGSTVGEALKALDAVHPGFAARLFDDDAKLRRFVNVFVADEDVRFLDGLNTPVTDGQTISIVPAVAGGAGVPSGVAPTRLAWREDDYGSTGAVERPITRP